MSPCDPSPRAPFAGAVFAGLLLVVVGGALVSGCYKPRILDGGFECATSGTPCPQGFECATDRHCWRDPSSVVPDSGPTCTAPPVTPLCNDQPAAGDACSPSCQTGCECGRCNVVDGLPTCVPAGSVKLGEICKFGKDDNCAPGLVCLQELCGNNIGRCYRHCSRNDQCGVGSICQFQIEGTDFKVCDVPSQACDPVLDTGCPNPALHCYITSGNQTLCDCANNATGKGMTGDPCIIYSDCAPGYVCFRNAGEEPRCHPACAIMSPACSVGTSCSGGNMYGHCG